MSMTFDLELAIRTIEGVIKDLNNAPEKTAIVKLIKACEAIDRHYFKTCQQIDEDYGDEPGTAYEGGFNMEYYIEGDWWQEVSEALRELREPNAKDD